MDFEDLDKLFYSNVEQFKLAFADLFKSADNETRVIMLLDLVQCWMNEHTIELGPKLKRHV